MRVLIDVCVLFLIVMCEVVIGVVVVGLFEVCWLDCILEEWVCVIVKLGDGVEVIVWGEIVVLVVWFFWVIVLVYDGF